MVKIRLKRIGAKKAPFYRIVVMNARSPRDGRALEQVGTYAPQANPSVVKIDHERAIRWLEQGAKPSETVHNLFRKNGVYQTWKPENPAKKAESE